MANIDTPIPMLKLNDGHQIPMLGYGVGTAWFKSAPTSHIDRAMVEAVKTAIKLGYHHLDAAEIYNTDRELGTAIKESKIERSELFVTSKVSKSFDDIAGALDRALKDLGLDYVDLYLIHSPFFAKTDEELQTAWQTMEGLKASGKARSIGVSNYLESHLKATLAIASIPPAVNQIEFHPYLQHGTLLSFHKEHDIATVAYSPLTAVTKAKPGPCDPLLAFLAKKYYVGEGDICLRWCIDRGVVALTTSGKEQRLSDYLRAMTFTMTPHEVKELSDAGLQKHFRGYFEHQYDANDRS